MTLPYPALVLKRKMAKLGKNFIYYCNKKNKVPRKNLNKEVKDLYSENYTTLKKKTKEDTNK